MQQSLINTAYEPDPAQCAFPVWTDVPDGYHCYPCPDGLWSAHFEAWRKLARHGVPRLERCEPMPAGHVMFERPREYGLVPYGCTDKRKIRRAWWIHYRAILNGWDRDLRQSREGMRTLARIIRVSVNAKMQGQEVGAFPFLECVAWDL